MAAAVERERERERGGGGGCRECEWRSRVANKQDNLYALSSQLTLHIDVYGDRLVPSHVINIDDVISFILVRHRVDVQRSHVVIKLVLAGRCS